MIRYGQALTPEAEGGFHEGDMPSASSFCAPVQGETLSWLRSSSAEENCSILNQSVCWPCQTLLEPE